jgi:hypothetical protein
VSPIQDHLKFMINAIKEASATPDAATGKVDVQVAESGIALVMQLHPLLSKIEVREEPITDTHEQMFWDLRDWFAAYEQFETVCIVHPLWGDSLPENRAARIKEILDIGASGFVDGEWVLSELAKHGYDFTKGTLERAITEAGERARATDPFAARMESEIDVEGEE